MPKLPLKDFIAKYGGIANRVKKAHIQKMKSGTVQHRQRREIVQQRTIFGDFTKVGKHVPEIKNMSHDDMTSEVKNLSTEYQKRNNICNVEINNGFCLDFTRELQRRVGGQIVANRSGNHFWLVWKGKYYDADIPEGTKYIENLPFIQRRYWDRVR